MIERDISCEYNFCKLCGKKIPKCQELCRLDELKLKEEGKHA